MIFDELFDVYHRDYMILNLSPNTIRGYDVNIRHVLAVFSGRDIATLTYTDIDQLVRYLRDRGLSNTSIVYVLSTLRSALGFAVRHGWLGVNMAAMYQKPRKERYHYTVWGLDEIKYFLTETKDSDFWPAFLIAGMFGARRGETGALRDIHIRPDRLLIRQSVTVINGKRIVTDTKNHRARDLLVPDFVIDGLRRYDAARPRNPDGYLIRSSSTGEALHPNSFGRAFHRYSDKLGLSYIRFHDLRHSYATAMAVQDVHPSTVQQVLGHSSVKITLDLYSHANIGMQKACLNAFGKVDFS